MSEGKKPSDKDVSSVRLAASERVSSLDPRTHAAWRTWLAALARDAEAATAAALAYQSLSGDGRDAWLDALDADAPDVGVPKVALYAPLLGVEQDEARRARIAQHVSGASRKSTPPRALVGTEGGSARVCIIVSPLYLDFVEVLLCRYDQDDGIGDARHEWLVHRSDVPSIVAAIGVPMAEAPLPQVVEELAHAVVADRRAGRSAPAALMRYIDLFAPDLDPAPAAAGLGDSSPDDS
ncbi:MAG: hypothetical protein JST00_24805 [Deltaproteobacteria bacterium]|nr:hypothetical protein [Deltaproteobacteria bacterium]